MKTQITHKVVLNHAKKTLTIKVYENGKIQNTYKDDFATSEIMEAAEDWTESDIVNYLRTSVSYYSVK